MVGILASALFPNNEVAHRDTICYDGDAMLSENHPTPPPSGPEDRQILRAGVFAVPKRLAQRRARASTQAAASPPSAPAAPSDGTTPRKGFLTPPNPELAAEMAKLAREAGVSPADIDAPVDGAANFLLHAPRDTNRPLPPASRASFGTDPDNAIKEALAYKKFLHDAWREIIFEETYTLEDTQPYRIRVAWRLLREIARTKGLVAPDEMLVEALEPKYMAPEDDLDFAPASQMTIHHDAHTPMTGFVDDPWLIPRPFVRDVGRERLSGPDPSFRYSNSVIEALLAAERVPEHLKCYYVQLISEHEKQTWKPVYLNGLPLMPPNVPFPHLHPLSGVQTGHWGDDYDPYNSAHDPLLHVYIKLLKNTAMHLYADQGSEVDPNCGRYGLHGLYDPALVRLSMPSRVQIMAWEALIVEDTLQQLVKNGQPQTKHYLYKTYGLRPHEIQQLIRIAKVRARQAVEGDVEEDRGLMVLRLEDAARRAREVSDLRAEMAALKNLAIVLGLARVDPQSAITDFVAVVKDAYQQRLESRPLQAPALTAPKQVVNDAAGG